MSAPISAPMSAPAGVVLTSAGAGHPGIVDAFLASRSEATRRAYAHDLDAFAVFLGVPTAGAAAARLIAASRGDANALVLAFRTDMQRKRKMRVAGGYVWKALAAATINRRLAAIRSCVALARVLGLVEWELEIDGLRVEPYRDTRGPGVAGVRAIMDLSVRVRDRAFMHLAYDNGLRRNEIHLLDLADLDRDGKRLQIMGKGRTAKEWVSLPEPTLEALGEWLDVRGLGAGPLFIAMDRGHYGARLSGTSIYRIIRDLGERVGIRARPHGLRHTAITAALDATNGDVRAVARFSRHRDLSILTRYDDDRRDLGGAVAAKVAAALAKSAA